MDVDVDVSVDVVMGVNVVLMWKWMSAFGVWRTQEVFLYRRFYCYGMYDFLLMS